MRIRTILAIAWLATSLATPPPGYVKKRDDDDDENPPAYEYKYDIGDEGGKGHGKAETRSGDLASGRYYVNASQSSTDVKYFADEWGYHPLVHYETSDEHSVSDARLALGDRAVKVSRNGDAYTGAERIESQLSLRHRRPTQIIQPYTLRKETTTLDPTTIHHATTPPSPRTNYPTAPTVAPSDPGDAEVTHSGSPVNQPREQSVVLVASNAMSENFAEPSTPPHSTSSQPYAYNGIATPTSPRFAPATGTSREDDSDRDYSIGTIPDELLQIQIAGNFGQRVQSADGGAETRQRYSTTTARLPVSRAYTSTKQNGDVTYAVHDQPQLNRAFLTAAKKSRNRLGLDRYLYSQQLFTPTSLGNANVSDYVLPRVVSSSTTVAAPSTPSTDFASSPTIAPVDSSSSAVSSTLGESASYEYSNAVEADKQIYGVYGGTGDAGASYGKLEATNPRLVNYELAYEEVFNAEGGLETRGASGDVILRDTKEETNSRPIADARDAPIVSASFSKPIVVADTEQRRENEDEFDGDLNRIVSSTPYPERSSSEQPPPSTDALLPVASSEDRDPDRITTSNLILNSIHAGVTLLNAGESYFVDSGTPKPVKENVDEDAEDASTFQEQHAIAAGKERSEVSYEKTGNPSFGVERSPLGYEKTRSPAFGVGESTIGYEKTGNPKFGGERIAVLDYEKTGSPSSGEEPSAIGYRGAGDISNSKEQSVTGYGKTGDSSLGVTETAIFQEISGSSDAIASSDRERSVEIQKSVEIYHNAPVREIHYPIQLISQQPRVEAQREYAKEAEKISGKYRDQAKLLLELQHNLDTAIRASQEQRNVASQQVYVDSSTESVATQPIYKESIQSDDSDSAAIVSTEEEARLVVPESTLPETSSQDVRQQEALPENQRNDLADRGIYQGNYNVANERDHFGTQTAAPLTFYQPTRQIESQLKNVESTAANVQSLRQGVYESSYSTGTVNHHQQQQQQVSGAFPYVLQASKEITLPRIESIGRVVNGLTDRGSENTLISIGKSYSAQLTNLDHGDKIDSHRASIAGIARGEGLSDKIEFNAPQTYAAEISQLHQLQEGTAERNVVRPAVHLQVPGAEKPPQQQLLIVHKHIPYPVAVTKIVEKEVPVPKPYPVEKIVEKTVHVPRPYPVEVEKIVEKRVPFPVEKIVEKTIAVPQPYAVHVRVPVDKIVEKPVPVPQPYPVHVDRIIEKKVPYPVEKIVEKTVAVPQPYPIHVQVPVDKIVEKPVPVPQPYPVHVERIIEKKVPYPVEKLVPQPYPVHIKVPQPYPVEKIVERKVPYPVEKIVERKVPYPVEVPKYIEKQVHPSQIYAGEKKVSYLAVRDNTFAESHDDRAHQQQQQQQQQQLQFSLEKHREIDNRHHHLPSLSHPAVEFYENVNHPNGGAVPYGVRYGLSYQQVMKPQAQNLYTTRQFQGYVYDKPAVALIEGNGAPGDVESRNGGASDRLMSFKQQSASQGLSKKIGGRFNNFHAPIPAYSSLDYSGPHRRYVARIASKENAKKDEYVGPVPPLRQGSPDHRSTSQDQAPPQPTTSPQRSTATPSGGSSSSTTVAVVKRTPEASRYHTRTGNFRQSKMEYGFKPPMIPSVQYDEETATAKVES